MQSMGRDPHILSKRLAAFVKRQGSAKELSDRIGCDVRTAENIREGHWPIARHWLGLLLAFGKDLTDAVFHPDEAAARLELEVAALDQALARKRADLLHAQSYLARLEKVRARPRQGPAEDLTRHPAP